MTPAQQRKNRERLDTDEQMKRAEFDRLVRHLRWATSGFWEMQTVGGHRRRFIDYADRPRDPAYQLKIATEIAARIMRGERSIEFSDLLLWEIVTCLNPGSTQSAQLCQFQLARYKDFESAHPFYQYLVGFWPQGNKLTELAHERLEYLAGGNEQARAALNMLHV
jgi:hypothetical protein